MTLKLKTAIYVMLMFMAGTNIANAQSAKILKAKNMGKWGVAAANYSGIAHISGNKYAVVSDKEAHGGFYILDIDINPKNGKIVSVKQDGKQRYNPANAARDEEGICHYPKQGTFFVSDERNQQIYEYDSTATLTGRQLSIPAKFGKDSVFFNCGFEALTCDTSRNMLYTMTERPLKSDYNGGSERVRLLAFDESLAPAAQYAYQLETPSLNANAKYYVHGVSGMTALPDGRLLVMERELSVPAKGWGAKCRIRIFAVNPATSEKIDNATDISTLGLYKFMAKKPVADFTTHINATSRKYANYEGICTGQRLDDGRLTLLLISDSQAGAGNKIYHLKDYVRSIVLSNSL